MTNVVGILVIVLVVTQLGVGDAVKRVAESLRVDPQELATNRDKLLSLRQQRQTLLAAMAESIPTDPGDQENRLEELRRQIAEKEQLLDQLEQDLKKEEERLASAKLLAAEAGKQVEENEKRKEERDQLQGELTTAVKELARLEAALDDTPVRQAPPPKVVYLPNPRSAPEGAQQLTFVCSQNKVYPLPAGPEMEQIRKLAQERALMVAQKQYRTFKPAEGEGIDRFLQEFNERPLGREWWSDYFDVKLGNYNSSPRLVFHPRENGGDTEKIVAAPRSKFRQGLQNIDRNKYYIRFYVCTDSFDIYLTTRAIMTEMGLLAGWEPQSTNWLYTTHLGGDLQLGPPPKPAPPPKTPPKPPPKRPADAID
jgi:hypothetical protein